MIGRRAIQKRGNRDDAEKPFWISFADLMTALMVLFLVSLSVFVVEANRQKDEANKQKEAAIIAKEALDREKEKLAEALEALKRQERERDTRREQRNADLKTFLDDVELLIQAHPGVTLDRERHVVDFGARARFRHGRHNLSYEQVNVLRRLVPELLTVARKDVGERWLKRIVVEGFTDQSGTYLFNLNLSLQRSQRVLCVLLANEWSQAVPPVAAKPTAPFAPIAPPQAPPVELTPIGSEDAQLIRSLFLVGGYSSNSTKLTAEDSRRIELRIEFFEVGEKREHQPVANVDSGRCSIGSG